MEKKEIREIIIRYTILLIIFLIGGEIFYFLFQQMTVFSSYGLLKIIYPSLNLVGTNFYLGDKTIEIIGACVASSAYLFLLFLNLTTPKIKLKTRIYTILASFITFFLINVIRIFYLSILYLNEASYFEILHKIFWYAGSTLFVVGIWIAIIQIWKIEEIPIYSDLKKIYQKIKKN